MADPSGPTIDIGPIMKQALLGHPYATVSEDSMLAVQESTKQLIGLICSEVVHTALTKHRNTLTEGRLARSLNTLGMEDKFTITGDHVAIALQSLGLEAMTSRI